MSKFAKLIYVVKRDELGDDPFMIADTDFTGFEHGEVVATYQLVRTDTLNVEHQLVPKRGKK